MEVIKNEKSVTLNDLQCGGTFEFDGELLIKTDYPEDNHIICIALRTGLSYAMGKDYEVSIIEAKVIY